MAKRQSDPAAPAADIISAEQGGAAPQIQQQQQEPPPEAVRSEPLRERVRPSDNDILDGMDDDDFADLQRLASLAEARRKAGSAALSPEDKELVRIYNKGRRRFDHAPYQSHPGAFVTVPRWLAKQWIRDYPGDFVAGDDALKTIDGTAAQLAEANVKIKQLEADLKAAQAEK